MYCRKLDSRTGQSSSCSITCKHWFFPPNCSIPPASPPAPLLHPVNYLNTAQQAVSSAIEVGKHLTIGKIWIVRDPAGEIEVKAGLIYQNMVVAVVRFNPFNGDILPEGAHVRAYDMRVTNDVLYEKLSDFASKLVVLHGAGFKEPENCWTIPIAYDGKIVTHLKIYIDGIHVIPDYVSDQEMKWYGR